MGSLSNYALSKLMDHVFKTAYTPLDTLYLSLCTTVPTNVSTGSDIVETDYTGYVRKAITVADFNAATLRKIIQAQDIEFAIATGNGSITIKGYAICDASTAGNVLSFGSFNSPFSIVIGNLPKVASGEIEISVGASTNGFTDIAVHKMLNLMFRNVAWSTPSTSIHAGLTTAIISDSDAIGDITECSGNGYAREPIPASSMDAATNGVTTNNAAITFDTPSGTWGLVTTVFIASALTAGDLLCFDNTNIVDQEPVTGDTIQFAIGAFDCSLT